MANATRDQNYKAVILGVSSADNTTPTRIAVNPATGAVLIDGSGLYPVFDTRYIKTNNASAFNSYVWPSADGGPNTVLQTNGSGTLSWASVSATPGGADTQVQFNDGGSFGGDAGLTYAKATDALTIGGNVVVSGIASQTNVINENGVDQDTRIEGDTEQNLVFVDASADRVGIGQSSPASRLQVAQANGAGDVAISIQNNATTNNETASLGFVTSTTPTANGSVIRVSRIDASNQLMMFSLLVGGNVVERSVFGASSYVINDLGNDYDTRIEGDTDANLLVTDGGLDAVGVGILSPTAKLHVNQSTLGNAVQNLTSVATNDDPNEIVYQNRVATTDATVTTLHTFTVPSSTTYNIVATVVARRTGGSSGTAEDGARYMITAAYKNVAGTATIIGSVTVISSAEDQAAWDATFDTTGATVRVRVTGAANNNITWHMTARVNTVST